MIDIEQAKKEFNKFTSNYDNSDERVIIKINHTYGVLSASEYISRKLGLDEEEINLAMLIGLLHDIGRFDQAKQFNSYEDYKNINHAQLGVDILFNKNIIRNFIKENKYDNIIYKAILNHNKYKIEEGLSKQELLYAKIIRDADKIDNYRVKEFQDLEVLCEDKLENIVKSKITPKIYNDFIAHKTIISSERITSLDKWVSYIAFLYDINFIPSIEYIKEKNSINRLVDRIKYEDNDTKIKMEEIRKCALEYIENRLKNYK